MGYLLQKPTNLSDGDDYYVLVELQRSGWVSDLVWREQDQEEGGSREVVRDRIGRGGIEKDAEKGEAQDQAAERCDPVPSSSNDR